MALMNFFMTRWTQATTVMDGRLLESLDARTETRNVMIGTPSWGLEMAATSLRWHGLACSIAIVI